MQLRNGLQCKFVQSLQLLLPCSLIENAFGIICWPSPGGDFRRHSIQISPRIELNRIESNRIESSPMDGEEIRAESHRIECTDVSSALPSPLPLLGHTSGALKTISHLQGWRITKEFMELRTPGQLYSRRAGFAMTTEAMASPQLTMQLMKSTNRQLDVFIHCISC